MKEGECAGQGIECDFARCKWYNSRRPACSATATALAPPRGGLLKNQKTYVRPPRPPHTHPCGVLFVSWAICLGLACRIPHPGALWRVCVPGPGLAHLDMRFFVVARLPFNYAQLPLPLHFKHSKTCNFALTPRLSWVWVSCGSPWAPSGARSGRAPAQMRRARGCCQWPRSLAHRCSPKGPCTAPGPYSIRL